MFISSRRYTRENLQVSSVRVRAHTHTRTRTHSEEFLTRHESKLAGWVKAAAKANSAEAIHALVSQSHTEDVQDPWHPMMLARKAAQVLGPEVSARKRARARERARACVRARCRERAEARPRGREGRVERKGRGVWGERERERDALGVQSERKCGRYQLTQLACSGCYSSQVARTASPRRPSARSSHAKGAGSVSSSSAADTRCQSNSRACGARPSSISSIKDAKYSKVHCMLSTK